VCSIRIESTEQPLVIRTTSRLRITIEYACDRPLQHPRFYVDVADQRGAAIYSLDTRCTGELADTLPANGAVMCETDPINLTPGRCSVHVAVYRQDTLADFVRDAARFDVEGEPFYPSGWMPDRYVPCVIRQKWSVSEKNY